MSKVSAKKKKNIGLLYEFLVRTMSRALVQENAELSDRALKIVKKYFKPGTELHKELKLFNALLRTTVTSESVASSIISEAKNAIRLGDLSKLDRERGLLIHSINVDLKDPYFYDQPISEYRTYATIGTLFEDWRLPTVPDLSRAALYEDALSKWLTSQKPEEPSLTTPESPGMNRFVTKLMTQKINDKYKSALTSEQKTIIQEYALYSTSGKDSGVKARLSEIRDRLKSELHAYLTGTDVQEFMVTKVNTVLEQLENEKLATVDESTVTRFMLYSKLGSELSSEDGDVDE